MGTCKQCKHFSECAGDAAIEGFEFNPDFDGQRGCTGFDPFTNADRIKAMSDEELADFQTARIVAESCLRLRDQGYTPTEAQRSELHEKLYKTWLDWLKQPSED